MGLFLTLQVQQTVTVPKFGHTDGTHGRLLILTVFHQEVAHADTTPRHTRQPGDARPAAVAFWGN